MGIDIYLQLSKMLRLVVNIHATKTNANGTRRDNDNPVSRLLKLDSSVDNECQDRQKRLMCLFIHNRACAFELS